MLTRDLFAAMNQQDRNRHEQKQPHDVMVTQKRSKGHGLVFVNPVLFIHSALLVMDQKRYNTIDKIIVQFALGNLVHRHNFMHFAQADDSISASDLKSATAVILSDPDLL